MTTGEYNQLIAQGYDNLSEYDKQRIEDYRKNIKSVQEENARIAARAQRKATIFHALNAPPAAQQTLLGEAPKPDAKPAAADTTEEKRKKLILASGTLFNDTARDPLGGQRRRLGGDPSALAAKTLLG